MKKSNLVVICCLALRAAIGAAAGAAGGWLYDRLQAGVFVILQKDKHHVSLVLPL
ncbi:MAG: hypothetical protein ABF290_02200 [Thiogranum sp.]